MVYFLYNLDYPHISSVGTPCNRIIPTTTTVFCKNKRKPPTVVFQTDLVPADGPQMQNSNLSHHCEVYALADFCRIEGLKTLAAAKFESEARVFWNHSDFYEVVKFLYSSTLTEDQEMRKVVVKVIMRHRELLERQEYKDLVKDTDLAYELLMEFHALSKDWP